MGKKQINVTELIKACIDPGSKTPANNIKVYGSIFHKIVEHFIKWLTSNGNIKKALNLDGEYGLWEAMYENFAESELDKILKKGDIDSANHLAKCLKAFCRRIYELKKRSESFKTWQDIFILEEFAINGIEFKFDEYSISVSGKIDSIRSDPDNIFEIVDYKLSRGFKMDQDLVQIAIYEKCLSIAKPGIFFRGVLEYYSPELEEIIVSKNELEGIFRNFVEPVLKELANNPMPFKALQNNKIEINDKSSRIENFFRSFKLEVKVIGKLEAPQLVRYMIKPSAGVRVVSLASRSEDLQVALYLKQPPVIGPAQGYVTIDIPKEIPDKVQWEDIIKKEDYLQNKSPISFPVGIGVDNNVIISDFADHNTSHALIAGATGSGKSEFLKCLAASLMAKNKPDRLKMIISDPKFLTFGSLKDSPFLSMPVINDVNKAISVLQSEIGEMDKRYKKLGNEGYENLSERFKAGVYDIPFKIIIFDEFADFILTGKDEKKEFENLVARLAAKGRAAGIHLVLATQRPDKNIVSGLIKANLPLKICLKVTASVNSQIILDENGGESLLGRGDLICDRGKGLERAQSPFITQEGLLYAGGIGGLRQQTGQ